MAHRIITQVVVTGARVFSRAFAEAWKQANARSRHAATSGGSSSTFSSSGITVDEACKILNIDPPKKGLGAAGNEVVEKELETVMDQFKKLFDMNDPNKGGSFYLQSKVLRARERLEAEIRDSVERETAKKQTDAGWSPKVYKDK